MSFLGIYFLGLFLILMAVTGVWLLSLFMKDSSIVDIFWGLGFVLLVIFYFGFTSGWGLRRFLITVLVMVWGLRLSGYLAWRNLGKGEDFRYQRWRKQFGNDWWWMSYLRVFLLQGFLIWLISAPLLAAQFHRGPQAITIFDLFGLFLWIIGFTFEAVGDWQLAAFKRDPANKGKIMDRGLWRYTRHPNYFGDTVQWWAFYWIAVSSPWGFLTIFSPVLMNFLLIRVSGKRMTEKHMTKRPGFEAYMQRTSGFFPLPPKRQVPPRR